MSAPQGIPDPAAADAPKPSARATRTAGRRTRSLLLDAASALFKQYGLTGVSIGDIAAAADAFPSQITYYFRTKEALFVEAACRDVLYVARGAEERAAQQCAPDDYTRALVESVVGSPGVGFFVEAMALTRRRQDLAPLVERTIERLHAEGRRAHAGQMAAHGWQAPSDAETMARRFWALAVGMTLEGQAMGRTHEELVDGMLHLLAGQSAAPQPQRKLHLVDTDRRDQETQS